jgi:hypothetical protein
MSSAPTRCSCRDASTLCTGDAEQALVAVAEARVALRELVGRVADYEIDEADAKTPNVRGFTTLSVRMTTR